MAQVFIICQRQYFHFSVIVLIAYSIFYERLVVIMNKSFYLILFINRNDMRAYSDRRQRQRTYPWERENTSGLSSSLESDRWSAEYGRDERLPNGPAEGPTCRKYISVVSEGNYFIASKAPLPDRIELRMCGTSGFRHPSRSLSIPDLCRVKMTPVPDPIVEDTVDAIRQEEVLLESACFHDHSYPDKKEVYVSQYTHHFDPNEPRSHIAGWKVDMEPKGIPHRRSPMCVLNNPVVSDGRKRHDRPKSAPPTLAYDFDVLKDEVEEDRLSSATLPHFSRTGLESSTSNDDLSSRLKGLIVEAEPPTFNDDSSSFGYEPSDDNSEASSFLQDRNRKRDTGNFSYSRPRLIRLSADFPGVRNLEKMRKKRQSMGSSSTGSQSPTPSPTNGQYGFFVALTSNDQSPLPKNTRRSYYSVS